MKLTFRDLKQQKFVIEAEPSETIGAVKEKIAQEKGWDAAQQKLIYSGKILQDAATVESYSIEEKGFIVCMVSKPKAAAAGAPSTSRAPTTPAPASAETPVAPTAPAPALTTTTANVPTTPTPAPAGTTAAAGDPASFNDPSSMLVGNQSESAISEMEAMGFERSLIDRAMRAAYFNPDRAIEYLLNGIPETAQQPQRPPSQGARGAGSPPAPAAATNPPAATGAEAGDQPINLFEAAAQAGQQGGATGGRGRGAAGMGGLGALGANLGAGAGAGGEGAGQTLEFLRNNPHFQQLRQLVQQQPAMLEPILQQVGAGNPQLAALIGQNQQEFLQLLSEDLDDDAPMPPGAQTISVTEEERDAIERLCRLGFSRDQVIQAYFACDKNEELAANFLFDQPDEGEDQ